LSFIGEFENFFPLDPWKIPYPYNGIKVKRGGAIAESSVKNHLSPYDPKILTCFTWMSY
jgi:hypothetical protein